jgi:type IV pilus assembly protein PilE
MDLRRRAGFTMHEVLIALVILAILTAIALPQYQRTVEFNYRQQARDLLTTIYYGERAYRVSNTKYVVPANWNDIYMDDPQVGSPAPINFAVTKATANAFTAKATRSGGMCGGRFWTVDETRTFGGNWGTCP